MTIIGYIIVDKVTRDLDWDGKLHGTAEDAIQSLTAPAQMYCRSEAEENEDKTYWAQDYIICPVIGTEAE